MFDTVQALNRLDILSTEIAKLRWDILSLREMAHTRKRTETKKFSFASLGAYGMWADRADMRDSVMWVSAQRAAWNQQVQYTRGGVT